MTNNTPTKTVFNGDDWSQIDTVLLDMDGTLLDLKFDNHFWNTVIPEQFAKRRGVTTDRAKEHLRPIFEREQGHLNWYCLDFWSEQLGFDVAALKDELAHGVAFRESARQFLDRLRDSHCNVLMVTNAHPETLRIKMQHIDLAPWFDHMLTSHQFGYAKESPHFWTTLHSEHPFDVARTLFIDDSEPVLAAAERFGVQHLITLRQPDSSQPLREPAQYPAIHLFDEIMRGLTA